MGQGGGGAPTGRGASNRRRAGRPITSETAGEDVRRALGGPRRRRASTTATGTPTAAQFQEAGIRGPGIRRTTTVGRRGGDSMLRRASTRALEGRLERLVTRSGSRSEIRAIQRELDRRIGG